MQGKIALEEHFAYGDPDEDTAGRNRHAESWAETARRLVDIHDIRLKDIGGDKGMTPTQAAAKVFKTLTRSIMKAATGRGRAGRAFEAAKKRALKGLKGLFK